MANLNLERPKSHLWIVKTRWHASRSFCKLCWIWFRFRHLRYACARWCSNRTELTDKCKMAWSFHQRTLCFLASFSMHLSSSLAFWAPLGLVAECHWTTGSASLFDKFQCNPWCSIAKCFALLLLLVFAWWKHTGSKTIQKWWKLAWGLPDIACPSTRCRL